MMAQYEFVLAVTVASYVVISVEHNHVQPILLTYGSDIAIDMALLPACHCWPKARPSVKQRVISVTLTLLQYFVINNIANISVSLLWSLTR